ncbi:hypothetical protein [Cohnella sp. GbtcB17]|uniref:glycoside hydrolase family 78 protein n=1 Tax=Cohnella sp. GbtcB17 TaxID=2824762 RepID=UPI001C302294|nr:hypothetical protein [Cohnella sp. GbtcB17]
MSNRTNEADGKNGKNPYQPVRLAVGPLTETGAVPSNTPMFRWTVEGRREERAFRLLVATRPELLLPGQADQWDTGIVRQWGDPGICARGRVRYAGPALSAGRTYYWKVQIGDDESEMSRFSEAAAFRMTDDLPDAKTAAAARVFGERNDAIYRTTLDSLYSRTTPDGYVPTSVTGAYPGQFVRDTAAHLFALLALADLPEARKVLVSLLDRIEACGAERAPQIMFADGSPPVMLDQPDGHYQLLLAWADYVQLADDRETERKYYPLVRDFAFYYLKAPYFDPKLNLLWNPAYEHARENVHMSVYDLLTNQFAVQALTKVAGVARRLADDETASLLENNAGALQAGIERGLTALDEDCRPVFGELRGRDSADRLLPGFSFVNLAPIPAAVPGAEEKTRNTLQAYERQGSFMWGEFRMLHTYITPNTTNAGAQVIGKGLAWACYFYATSGDWNRLSLLQEWLETYNTVPLFGEAFNFLPFSRGEAYIQDGGNQEQASWFIWAQAQIRRLASE